MKPDTALLVVDAQVDMFDPANPVHSSAALLGRLMTLIERSRQARIPVLFVRNSGAPGDPDEPGTPGWEIHPAIAPAEGEPIVDKSTGDAFAGTRLHDDLQAAGVRRVIIAGLQSEYCIRDTVLGALARGFEVTLVSDGHGTYDAGGRAAAEISAAINTELAGRVTLVGAGELRFPGDDA
jgi:nicotinamidase-related amidase